MKRLRGLHAVFVAAILFLPPASAQEPAARPDPVHALVKAGRMTDAALTTFHASVDSLEALFDHLWTKRGSETMADLDRVLVPTREDEVVHATITRFRRAALLEPRLRSLVLRSKPTSPYEAATRVEALARETDPSKIMDHVRSGVDLGLPWIATLVEKIGRDPSSPAGQAVLAHVARHRRQRLSGLESLRMVDGQAIVPANVGQDDALILHFRRRKSERARLLVGDQVVAEIAEAVESMTVTGQDVAAGTLRVEAAGDDRLESVTFVSRRLLDATCCYRRRTIHDALEVWKDVPGCRITTGWRSALVVTGDEAAFPFFLEDDVDPDTFRALYIDHWSPSLSGWRSELNGSTFVALTSQPMPRPARVPRLRRGLLKRGWNLLKFRREQGSAPLHLETLWLWP